MARGPSKTRTAEGGGEGARRVASSPVTIKDIAAALGVSHSTVSRALNDHSHISADMKERVRRTAMELGYIAHAGARTLRQAHGRLIGMLAPNVMNQLFAVMIKVLAARCARAGYQLVLCVTEDDPEAELRHVEALRQSRATGLVIVPTSGVLSKTALLMAAMPVVQFSRSHPAIAAPSVAIDGARGISNAVRHLADLGHRRIAYVGLSTGLSTGAARAAGFTEAMAQRGRPVEPGLFHHGGGTIEYARSTTAALLRAKRPPTAIIYGSADLTEGGLESLRREDVAVPAHISIIGFGDPGWFKLMTPGLSTVGLSLSESAEAAISMLLRQIEARETGSPLEPQASLELEPFLILRETTAPPRAEG
jgi:LacI family transcriptional regulator